MDVLTISMGFGVASYVAILLDYVAREDLGFSDLQICATALVAAICIAAALAVDLGRRSTSKAE